MQGELKSKVVNGVQWTTISTVTTAVVQLLRLSILARFLEKSDFGLVAIITFVFGVIELIGEMGFSSAIMHKKDLSRDEFSSLYWIQFLLLALFLAITPLLAKPIAVFYKEPRIEKFMPISLLGLLFIGIGKLYDTVFQKAFKFKLIAIRNIISALISFVVAVVVAANGGGVYSLVISMLAQQAVFYIWNFIVGQRLMPISFHVSFREVKQLVIIGIYQTGTQILSQLASQLDVLIVGKILGMEILGVYNLARDLLNKFVTVINSVANRVALPLFSMIQNNLESMRDNYCKMLRMLTSINFPIIAAMGALSVPIVLILYGDKFADASYVMTVLASASLLGVIDNPSGSITTARGRTDLSFFCMVSRLLIVTPIVLVTSYWGLDALLAGKVVISILQCLIVWFFMLWMSIKLPLGRYLGTFIKPFLICVVSYVSCHFLIGQFFAFMNPALLLFVGGCLFLVIYLTLTGALNKKEFVVLKGLLHEAKRTLLRKRVKNDEVNGFE